MRKRFRFSLRSLLMATLVTALSMALVVQHWQHHAMEMRRKREIVSLRDQLNATQQMLEELPVDNPRRAYALAMPSFAYARWTWRVYLPPNSRYGLRVDVGHVVEEGATRRVSAAQGHSQQMGLQGRGEMVVIVERFITNNRQLLGVSVGRQQVNCRLTPDVQHCMAERAPYQEEQLGSAGAEEIVADDRIDLLMRWYTQDNAPTTNRSNRGPPGFSVWLEPF